MKAILEHLFQQGTLNRHEARETLTRISTGNIDPIQIAAFLTAFQVRGITVEELAGFRDALIELCIPIDLSAFDPVDLCGTGGDGKDTFNISTLASFITAGAGIHVAKHGNYGVSSICGSSNVLEQFGFEFAKTEDGLKRQLEASGLCFMHAPLFHPAMKAVAPVRKSLGVRTFFNMLGPMVNPARPKRQLVGVFSLELQRFYQYLFQEEEKEYRIIHALDGYDEVSLTSETKILSPGREQVVRPESFSEVKVGSSDILGGKSIQEATALFKTILKGEGTDQQNAVVTANSALAIQCAKPELNIEEATAVANESLQSGKARRVLEKLIAA